MKSTLTLCVVAISLMLGCAQAPVAPQTSSDANAAECKRRVQADGQDVSTSKGAARYQYCLETIEQEAAMPKLDPDVATSVKAFGECKAAAATKNLSLDAHQQALFDCARVHAGERGHSCLRQLFLQKVRLSALESELAFCMQTAPKR